jgi:hypothetical protein
VEVLSVLEGLAGRELLGGPLSEHQGVFWIALPERALDEAKSRFPRLGYVTAVDTIQQALRQSTPARIARWRGVDYEVTRIYQEDAARARDAAPDRRPFLARIAGELREIRGYRGDGSTLGRRGLPACDAALLANIAGARCGRRIIDPFAGAGGILHAAIAGGATAVAGDVDPWLGDGLSRISLGRHAIVDGRALPYRDASIDAAATEPPFDPQSDAAVLAAVPEIHRVLKPGGKLALMCATRQAAAIADAAATIGFRHVLASDVDRKGTPCAVFLWEKP